MGYCFTGLNKSTLAFVAAQAGLVNTFFEYGSFSLTEGTDYFGKIGSWIMGNEYFIVPIILLIGLKRPIESRLRTS
jgi:hypothetical protein